MLELIGIEPTTLDCQAAEIRSDGNPRLPVKRQCARQPSVQSSRTQVREITIQLVERQSARISQGILAGGSAADHEPDVRIQDMSLELFIVVPLLDDGGLMLHVVRVPRIASD